MKREEIELAYLLYYDMYLWPIMEFSWSFSDDPGRCIKWVTANLVRMNRTR